MSAKPPIPSHLSHQQKKSHQKEPAEQPQQQFPISGLFKVALKVVVQRWGRRHPFRRLGR